MFFIFMLFTIYEVLKLIGSNQADILMLLNFFASCVNKLRDIAI